MLLVNHGYTSKQKEEKERAVGKKREAKAMSVCPRMRAGVGQQDLSQRHNSSRCSALRMR